jgi:hypothetical protein
LKTGKFFCGIDTEHSAVAFGLDGQVGVIVGLRIEIEKTVSEDEVTLGFDGEVLCIR